MDGAMTQGGLAGGEKPISYPRQLKKPQTDFFFF